MIVGGHGSRGGHCPRTAPTEDEHPPETPGGTSGKSERLALAIIDRIALAASLVGAWLGTWMWSVRVRRALTRSPTHLRGGPERFLVPIWMAWTIGILAVALAPEPCAAACVWEPATTISRTIGPLLVLAGSSLVIAASIDIGSSWRIGVDTDTPGHLVTTGIYQYTRNPIFEGIILALAGIVVWVPAVPLAALWGLTLLLVRAQITREEKFLARTWGSEYLAYSSRVGRWGPRVGVHAWIQD